MKKRKGLQIFIFLMIVPFLLMGQKLHYGVQAGYNSLNVKYINLPISLDYTYLTPPSFSFSGNVRYQKSKRWSVSLEPGFAQKKLNVRSTVSEPVLPIRVDIKLSFVELPILLEYSLDDKMRFFAGPNFSALIKEKVNTKIGAWTQEELFNELELLGVVGFYYSVTKRLSVGVRYSRGLSPISSSFYNYPKDIIYENVFTYSRAFQTSLRVEL